MTLALVIYHKDGHWHICVSEQFRFCTSAFVLRFLLNCQRFRKHRYVSGNAKGAPSDMLFLALLQFLLAGSDFGLPERTPTFLKDRCFVFWRAVVLAVFFFESWRCAQTNLFRIVRIMTGHPSLLHSLQYDARVSYCEYRDMATELLVGRTKKTRKNHSCGESILLK